MDLKALLIIVGVALLALAILAPLALWIARGFNPQISKGRGFTRVGLLFTAVLVLLLVLGAIFAQNFGDIGSSVFLACYVVAIAVLFGLIERSLEKRGRSLYRERSDRP